MYNEVMKKIQGQKGYYIDKNGNVFSKRRAVNKKDGTGFKSCIVKEVRRLKPQITMNGYLTVTFGDRKRKLVHRLVAIMLIPNPENKPYVCHKDGNKRNNHIDNLYWGTAAENMADCKKHGTYICGEKSVKSKLKEIQVLEIKRLLKKGSMSQHSIAKKFDISRSTIRNIHLNISWKHIKV